MKRGFGVLFGAAVLAWLIVAVIVHNQVWAGASGDGFLVYLLFDGIAAAVAVGVFVVPLAVLLWLWDRFKR